MGDNGASCPCCFQGLAHVLYIVRTAFLRRFQCTRPHPNRSRTEGDMIEILCEKSMQGGFQLEYLGNQWMDHAEIIVWCYYTIGQAVYQLWRWGNESPWTHIQNRVGKAKMGGCRWGYHRNHLSYGLVVLICCIYTLGKLIYQPIWMGNH